MQYRLSAIDWDDLKFFLAVARAGSLRGAADRLEANHATVSRRLTALEQAVDARLFDRGKGGLTLTQAGEELRPHAVSVEEEVAAVSRLIAGRDARPAGPVYVSMPPMMAQSAIMDELAAFGQQYEDIDIHLQLSNAFADFDRREADVSIRYAHEVTDDVVGRRVLRCAKAVYCSPGYAARMKDDGGEGLTWIGWTEPEGKTTAPWIRKSPFPKARLRHRVNEGAPQMALAAEGVGLSYLPCFVAERYPGIVRAPFNEPVLDRSIWLLLHSDLRNTARIRLFVDFLARRIRAHAAEFTGGAVHEFAGR